MSLRYIYHKIIGIVLLVSFMSCTDTNKDCDKNLVKEGLEKEWIVKKSGYDSLSLYINSKYSDILTINRFDFTSDSNLIDSLTFFDSKVLRFMNELEISRLHLEKSYQCDTLINRYEMEFYPYINCKNMYFYYKYSNCKIKRDSVITLSSCHYRLNNNWSLNINL